MRKIQLLFIVLLFFCNAKSQDNLKLYYRYINKAELAITKNDTKNASKFYGHAFHYKEKPFRTDIYHAINIEKMNLHKTDSLKQFNFEYIKKLAYYKRIENSCDTIKNKISKELKNKLDSLFLSDQHPFNYESRYLVENSLVKKNDSLNILAIIGIMKNNDTIIDAMFRYNSAINIILLHAYQQGFFNTIHDFLLQKVKQGKFDARNFAFYEDFTQFTNFGLNYGTLNFYGMENYYFLSFENEKQINKNRKTIFLESLKDKSKKAEWQVVDSLKDLILYVTNFETGDFEIEKKEIERIKKNKLPIKIIKINKNELFGISN